MFRKVIFIVVFVILVSAGIVFLIPGERLKIFEDKSMGLQDPTNGPLPSNSPTATALVSPSTAPLVGENNPQGQIVLMFVGDIMLSRSVGEKMKKENNWNWPFLNIAETIKKADLLFGNLEGPISDKGANVGSIYSFRADPRVVEGLTFSGFDVLSVANNHMFDWSRIALEDTLKRLKDSGISYTGAGLNEKEAHSPTIKEVQVNDGSKIKIAFLGYCSEGSQYWAATADRSGISWLEENKLKEDIIAAKNQANILIVSMHSGEEYKTWPNSSQRFFSQLAIDSGADLVIGHHPHVLQPVEQYKNGYIAFSLGNFVFDQTFSPQTKESVVLKVVVENPSTDSEQVVKIKSVEQLKAEISNDFQVSLK